MEAEVERRARAMWGAVCLPQGQRQLCCLLLIQELLAQVEQGLRRYFVVMPGLAAWVWRVRAGRQVPRAQGLAQAWGRLPA